MDAQILRTPPVSGELPEVRFDAVGDCTWVCFDLDDPWVGVFGHGFHQSSAVASIEGSDTAFVVSGGQGYLVRKSTRELVYTTDCDYLKSVIAVPRSSTYVASSDTDLFAYTESGLDWRSPRVSVDGVRLLRASENRVEGEVYDLSRWVPFTLSVPAWRYSCEWQCPFD